MKKLLVAFTSLALITGAGCGGGGADEILGKMRSFKDKMCKCGENDTKCAQAVSDEMTKWSTEQSKNAKEPPKMSEEDTKKAAAIGEEMSKCMQKAMTPAAAAPADPAAAPADPAAAPADPAAAPAAGAAPAAPAAEEKK